MIRRIYILVFAIMFFTPAHAQFSTELLLEDTTKEHVAGSGLLLFKGKEGELNFNPFGYLRYLNQLATDNTYTDVFGRTFKEQRRNDLMLAKIVLYFKGWLHDPRFNYIFYVWTSNVIAGQGGQVVVSGSIQYRINKYVRLGGGVVGLPSVRSLLGNFPNWLGQDARPMADEFFRASFTMALWSQGEIAKGLYYKTALGNNLSSLGVSAGQLDNGFDTWSTALWWTTNDFGAQAPYSDFEEHQKPATLLGGAYTRSNETKQSQPGSDAPENTQIRLSDGTVIFSINAFGPNTQVNAAKYEMASMYGGVKFKGISLDVDYYMRWISMFKTTGTIPINCLFDKGYTLQAAYMLINKTLDIHGIWSYVDGQYGKPWEFIGGLNWYPYKNRFLRLNPEVRLTHNSPVGYLAFPTFVGATGPIYVVSLELNY